MASRFAYLVNRSRVLGVNASSQLGKSSNNNNQRVANNFIARSSSTASSDEPLRRRRRRVGGSRSPGDNNQKLVPDDPSINTIADNASAAFAPKDSQGNLLDAQEYLSLADRSDLGWRPLLRAVNTSCSPRLAGSPGTATDHYFKKSNGSKDGLKAAKAEAEAEAEAEAAAGARRRRGGRRAAAGVHNQRGGAG